MPHLFVDDYLFSLRETSSDAETLDKTYGIMRAQAAAALGSEGPAPQQ